MSMGPLTIRYDIPGTSPLGQPLEEIVLRPTAAIDGIAFIVDPALTLSQRTYETLARATGRVSRALGLRARSFAIRCTSHHVRHSQTGHDCSGDGDAVLDVTVDRQWSFSLWLALLRARDLLSGRFPSMHASARLPWVDALWSLSLEGRLSTRGVLRSTAQETAVVAPDAHTRARNELIAALIWSGKERGLSLPRNDAERMAREVWSKDVSLREVVALGEKFGFRLEGPLATNRLAEVWPRHAVRPRTNVPVGTTLTR